MAFDGNCFIRRAGISPEGLAQLDLKATDGTSFDWSWFLSEDGRGREVLAVALAAITSDKQVACQMQDVAPWSRVSRILLVK